MKKICVMALMLLGIVCFNTSVNARARNIGVIGTGYVGLTVGACLAEFGHHVTCADIDATKIDMLNNGKIPIYEPGLEEMVTHWSTHSTLKFSSDPGSVIESADVVFIAVGTPMDEDGQADLRAIRAVAKTIGTHLNGYKLICTKSTVPIGTGSEIMSIIKKFAPAESEFDVVSNPEFLKEGTAISDFMQPDRVVIGCHTDRARKIIDEVYWPLHEHGVPFVYTDIITAETIKYACNAFLAVKISFINEMANLCDATLADVLGVVKGMGYDSRIGHKFLRPGPGYGGSCFPKDVQAILYKSRVANVDLKVISSAVKANELQKELVFKKFSKLLGDNLADKKIAVLGLAFKPNTDDIRYSPAITFITKALEAGAHIRAYDPIAIDSMRKEFPCIDYHSSLYDAVQGVDGIAILTEWDEFCTMDLAKVKDLVKTPILLDGRNILKVNELQELGFVYDNIGHAKV